MNECHATHTDCPEGHKLYRFAQQANVSVEQEADDSQGTVDGACDWFFPFMWWLCTAILALTSTHYGANFY